MKYNKTKFLACTLAASMALTGCAGTSKDNSNSSTNLSDTISANSSGSTDIAEVTPISTAVPTFNDEDLIPKEIYNTSISLSDDTAQINGSGASLNGSAVTITQEGTYLITGQLNGQIVVDAASEDEVYLILSNVDITCQSSAPLYVKNAKKVILTLEEDSENTFTDSTDTKTDENGEPTGAIFSHDDLVINGSGSLTVNAGFNDGIVTKDDLKIISGNISVTSAGDGIRGKDYVAICGGSISINAGNDGIKSTNTEEKGYIYISGGDISIVCEYDGIQAESYVAIDGGDITITSGGGSPETISSSEGGWGWGQGGWNGDTVDDNSASKKGIKGGTGVYISNGAVSLDSYDDALHSNIEIVVNGGALSLSSGDDGIHADTLVDISGSAEINITKSYEGIEAAQINLSGGNVTLVASDDGLNASDGDEWSVSAQISISGGTFIMDAGGDGIDSNGSVTMTGGTVICYGPTNSGNGALDYASAFTIQGGTLLAVGASGMVQSPSASEQAFVSFTGSFQANSELEITNGNGDVLFTCTPPKTFQSIIFSSADLIEGESYTAAQGSKTAVGRTATQSNGMNGGGNFGGRGQNGNFGNGEEPNREIPDGMPGGKIPNDMPNGQPLTPSPQDSSDESTFN